MVFKKHLRYIFIPVLAVLLMSHNVFAVNADKFVNSGVYGYNGSGSSMIFGGSTIYGSTVESNSLSFEMMAGAATSNVSNFFLRMNGTVPANSIYYFTMTTCSVYDYGSNYKVFGLAFRGDFTILQTDLGEQYLASGTNKYCRQYSYKLYSTAANFGIQGLASRHIQVSANTNLVVNFTPVSWVQLGDDADYTSALQSISNKQSQTNQKLDSLNSTIQQQHEEEKQAINDSIDDSQDIGDDALSDSETATQSLLDTITGFFNAIMHLDPSNCKFNSGLPFLSGEGEIDLCSVQTPPVIQVLSSLVLVGLFIPFAIHMFNRFISITESFQR